MSEGARRARHAQRGSALSAGTIALVVGALALLAIGLGGGYLLARGSTGSTSAAPSGAPAAAQPAASSSALPSSSSRPTMLADITRVVTGDEVIVRAAGADVPVRILGLTTPEPMTASPGGTAECGSREALQYADQRLTGQTVTLVPDPTQPELDDQGRRLAYVVLRSQLNYTDAALVDGIGRADTSRPLWYADVFDREQRAAVTAAHGIWGAPCRAHS